MAIHNATVEISIDAGIVTDNYLLVQSQITFGHLAGLAPINGADLGANISFGTIQDTLLNEFTIQWDTVTPEDRILKIFKEDRITISEEEVRIIKIKRT